MSSSRAGCDEFPPCIRTSFVIERLGKYHRTLSDGFNIITPLIDRVAYKHCLKEVAVDVEPVGLEFRWYAWYMAGYDRARRDYRIFKLVRMERIARAKAFSGIVHSRPGDGIKIISPDHIRNRIVEHSRKILDSYD